MREFTQKELQNLLYKSKYNNSNSKYNSNLFIGKNILGINILGFLSSDRELGILYPVFICQCFCGRLFLRECRHIENSKKISCGHCNDHIKKKIAFYSDYNKVPENIITELLNEQVYIFNYSKYASIKPHTKINQIEVLKYIPSLKENWPPLFICKCLICNKLFLGVASVVANGEYKTCGRKGCKAYNFKNKEQKERKEKVKTERELKVNDLERKLNTKKDGFILRKVLRGYKLLTLKCECEICGNIQDINYLDWEDDSVKLSCKNCKSTEKIEQKLIEKGVDPKFLTHNLEDYNKYKFLLYESDKYIYMGKGRISNGIQYVWLRCRNCCGIIEVDGAKYLNGDYFDTCYCYKPYTNIEFPPIDLFKISNWYIKYSDEKIGQKIGTDILLGRGNTNNTVRVKCERCGSIREVDEEEYFNERTNYYNMCSCVGDREKKYLKGEKFGHLTLQDETDDSFIFECDCENTVKYDKSYFRHHSIKTCGRSCNLNKFASAYSGIENKNRQYGSLRVKNLLQRITFTDENLRKGVYWSCECQDCHRINTYLAQDLENQNVRNCTCQKDKYLYQYPIGSEVNGIKILDILVLPKQGKATIWQCECPYCGDMFVRDPNSIVSGHCGSCGCVKISKGEAIILSYLQELKDKGIIDSFEQEVSFSDLIYRSPLRFDFKIIKGDKFVLVEFDGEQHETGRIPRVSNKEKAEKIFNEIKIRDNLKNKYAKDKNISLLRIKYTLKSEKIKNEINIFLKKEGVF